MDAASAEYQEQAETAIEAESYAVEAAVIAIIAHRIASLPEGASISEALSHSAMDWRKIAKAVEQGAKDVSRAADKVLDDMADANDEWAKDFYTAKAVSQSRKETGRILEQSKEGARKDVSRLLSTKVIGLTVDGRYRPLRAAYTAIVSEAVRQAAASELDYNKAVDAATRKALSQMCESGVRVKYESGATRELYGAVRMNVMDTYRKALTDYRWKQGEEYGADWVEISAHSMCAPDHLPHQGKQMSMKEFERVQDALDRDIAEGMNCRHTVYPILKGVKPAYSDSALEKMREESEQKVTVTGLSSKPLEMTRYEATQYQRRIEQQLRRVRLERGIGEAEGLDVSDLARRDADLMKAYRRLSEEAELTPKLERADVYIPR